MTSQALETPQGSNDDAALTDQQPQQSEPSESRLLEMIAALVDPLARALGRDCEVVLHDLSRLPNSVIAVAGDVTGRREEAPASDLLLRQLTEKNYVDLIGYRNYSVDGAAMRSSSIFIRNSEGIPIGCLCVNQDISKLASAEAVLAALTETTTLETPLGRNESAEPITEQFPTTVDQLAETIVTSAIQATGVPVALMKKRHKVDVVHTLEGRGFFTLRESVEVAARALGVTRYTVYKYRRETQ